MAQQNVGKMVIEVPDGFWDGLLIVIESWRDGDEHPFEDMDEQELQFLIADELGIGVEHVYCKHHIY